jgi:serine/threonine-protein kinase RsbW
MLDSVLCAEVADGRRFECVDVAADAESASQVREQFAGWLERFFDLDPIRSSDLVLAINEALANAAEYAYVTTARSETMDLLALYDAGDATLTVQISDNGLWQVPGSGPAARFRGKGIPLMKALSDRVTINTSTDGTQVRLQWARVAERY